MTTLTGPFVYFIGSCDDDGKGVPPRVKIGWSHDPNNRLEIFRQHSSEALKLIGVIPCTYASIVEKELQNRFSHSLIHHEWYKILPGTDDDNLWKLLPSSRENHGKDVDRSLYMFLQNEYLKGNLYLPTGNKGEYSYLINDCSEAADPGEMFLPFFNRVGGIADE